MSLCNATSCIMYEYLHSMRGAQARSGTRQHVTNRAPMPSWASNRFSAPSPITPSCSFP